MGGGASLPMNRLRKALLIRAYNARSELDTIRDQFCRYRRLDQQDGRAYITMSDIKKALKVDSDSLWMDNLLKRSELNSVSEIDYESFIAFLETGTQPICRDRSGHSLLPPPVPSTTTATTHRTTTCSSTTPAAASEVRRPVAAPPSATTAHGEAGPKREEEEERAAAAPPVKVEVVAARGKEKAARTPEEETEIVVHKGTTVSLRGKDAVKRPKPKHPLWRKRETLIQERIVQYTTIDTDGTIQELVEREKSQTEVLHMECKETGEFAHRETTEYEQSETFNEEVVAEEHGTEEYVHLKSKDDEYEFMESTMPRKHHPPPHHRPDGGHEGMPHSGRSHRGEEHGGPHYGHPRGGPHPREEGEGPLGGDAGTVAPDAAEEEGPWVPQSPPPGMYGVPQSEEEEEEMRYWMMERERELRRQAERQQRQGGEEGEDGQEGEEGEGPIFIDNDERVAVPMEEEEEDDGRREGGMNPAEEEGEEEVGRGRGGQGGKGPSMMPWRREEEEQEWAPAVPQE